MEEDTMRHGCVIILLSVLGAVLTPACLEGPVDRDQVALKIPPCANRDVLGAVKLGKGGFALATLDYSGAGYEVLRFIECEPGGSIRDIQALNIKFDFDCKAFIHGGQLAVGWLDLTGRIWSVRKIDGRLRQEVLFDAPDQRSRLALEWWLFQAGGRQHLFILREGVAMEDRQVPDELKARQWLYHYDVVDGQPRFVGKTCVEEHLFLRSIDLKCALWRDCVYVWQTVWFPPPAPPPDRLPTEAEMEWLPPRTRTLRVAKWEDDGALKWRKAYTGSEGFLVAMDPSEVSRVLVQEQKVSLDPKHTICSVVDVEGGEIVALSGVHTISGRPLRIAGQPQGWMVSSYSSDRRLEIRQYDNAFGLLRKDVLPDREIQGFWALEGNDSVHVMVLEGSGIAVRNVSRPR